MSKIDDITVSRSYYDTVGKMYESKEYFVDFIESLKYIQAVLHSKPNQIIKLSFRISNEPYFVIWKNRSIKYSNLPNTALVTFFELADLIEL